MHLYSAARLAAEQSVVWIRSVTDCEKPLPTIDIVSFCCCCCCCCLALRSTFLANPYWSLVGRSSGADVSKAPVARISDRCSHSKQRMRLTFVSGATLAGLRTRMRTFKHRECRLAAVPSPFRLKFLDLREMFLLHRECVSFGLPAIVK